MADPCASSCSKTEEEEEEEEETDSTDTKRHKMEVLRVASEMLIDLSGCRSASASAASASYASASAAGDSNTASIAIAGYFVRRAHTLRNSGVHPKVIMDSLRFLIDDILHKKD